MIKYGSDNVDFMWYECSEPEGRETAYMQSASEVDGWVPFAVTKHEAMLEQTGKCSFCKKCWKEGRP